MRAFKILCTVKFFGRGFSTQTLPLTITVLTMHKTDIDKEVRTPPQIKLRIKYIKKQLKTNWKILLWQNL